MTPALKAMVEAMIAEAERQTDAVFRDDDGKTLCLSVEGGSIDLEKVARAGLTAIRHPTDEMVVKGWRAATGKLDHPTLRHTFDAMVDEILKETP